MPDGSEDATGKFTQHQHFTHVPSNTQNVAGEAELADHHRLWLVGQWSRQYEFGGGRPLSTKEWRRISTAFEAKYGFAPPDPHRCVLNWRRTFTSRVARGATNPWWGHEAFSAIIGTTNAAPGAVSSHGGQQATHRERRHTAPRASNTDSVQATLAATNDFIEKMSKLVDIVLEKLK